MPIRLRRLALLGGCLAGLLLPAAALGAPVPSHPLIFSLAGEVVNHVPTPPPEGEFEDACGVAVDPAGDLYVSDYYHHTVDVYGPGRGYLTQIADPDPDGPCNLAVDAAGDIYVDNWHRDVVRYAPSEFPPTEATRYGAGQVIDFPTGPGARSTGVALDPGTGDLFVDDRTYVAVYEPLALATAEPQPSRTFGLGVLGAGYGVAVSAFPATEGDVYVPDALSGTVRVFDPSGAPAGTIDGAGTPQRGFVSLTDSAVAVDPTDGHIFVADDTEPGFESPAAVVDEFNASGAYRGQLPHAIVDAEPSALATDPTGRVYVTSGNTEGAASLGFGPTEAAHLLEVAETDAGSGSVTSEPAGIDCGSACAAEYAVGEEVALTAVPAQGSAFAAWSGCDRTSGVRCVVTMSSQRLVSAEFEPAPAPLTVRSAAVAPAGSAAPATAPAPAVISLRRGSSGAGSVLVELGLPSAGTISLHGGDLLPITRRATAGPRQLRLHLDRAGSRALSRSKLGELAVAVHARFRPSGGGAPLGATRRIVFKAEPHGRRR
jgi:DNA-binding beta-propeller fold protein YncE